MMCSSFAVRKAFKTNMPMQIVAAVITSLYTRV